jgi:TolA-binding protein
MKSICLFFIILLGALLLKNVINLPLLEGLEAIKPAASNSSCETYQQNTGTIKGIQESIARLNEEIESMKKSIEINKKGNAENVETLKKVGNQAKDMGNNAQSQLDAIQM